jgi:hypothetical protein
MHKNKQAFDLLSLAQPALTGAAVAQTENRNIAQTGSGASVQDFATGDGAAQGIAGLQDMASSVRARRSQDFQEKYLGVPRGEAGGAIPKLLGGLAGSHSYGKEVAPFMVSAEREALAEAQQAQQSDEDIEAVHQGWLKGFAHHKDPELSKFGWTQRRLAIAQQTGDVKKAEELQRQLDKQMRRLDEQRSRIRVSALQTEHNRLTHALRKGLVAEPQVEATRNRLAQVRKRMQEAQLAHLRLNEMTKLQESTAAARAEQEFQRKEQMPAQNEIRKQRLMDYLAKRGYVFNRETQSMAGTGLPDATPDEPSLRELYADMRKG